MAIASSDSDQVTEATPRGIAMYEAIRAKVRDRLAAENKKSEEWLRNNYFFGLQFLVIKGFGLAKTAYAWV